MANIINTLISTIKSGGRASDNILQILNRGVHKVEGFTEEFRDYSGKTLEEAKEDGKELFRDCVKVYKEVKKKATSTFSLDEPEEIKKNRRGRPKKSSS